MTTSITNEYTSLYKSLTLYFRKGDACCVRNEWRHGRTAILTHVLLSRILAWVAHPEVTKAPKPSICSWLSLRHPVSNCLKPSGHLVILFSNAHTLPLFFHLFTQVHLFIDGSVEGQYITLNCGNQ